MTQKSVFDITAREMEWHDWVPPHKRHGVFYCPSCQAELVERTGPYGKFLACPDRDFCGYTSPINESEQRDKYDSIMSAFGSSLEHEDAGDRGS